MVKGLWGALTAIPRVGRCPGRQWPIVVLASSSQIYCSVLLVDASRRCLSFIPHFQSHSGVILATSISYSWCSGRYVVALSLLCLPCQLPETSEHLLDESDDRSAHGARRISTLEHKRRSRKGTNGRYFSDNHPSPQPLGSADANCPFAGNISCR